MSISIIKKWSLFSPFHCSVRLHLELRIARRRVIPKRTRTVDGRSICNEKYHENPWFIYCLVPGDVLFHCMIFDNHSKSQYSQLQCTGVECNYWPEEEASPREIVEYIQVIQFVNWRKWHGYRFVHQLKLVMIYLLFFDISLVCKSLTHEPFVCFLFFLILSRSEYWMRDTMEEILSSARITPDI